MTTTELHPLLGYKRNELDRILRHVLGTYKNYLDKDIQADILLTLEEELRKEYEEETK